MIGDIEYCYFCGRPMGIKVDNSDYAWCGYCNTEGINAMHEGINAMHEGINAMGDKKDE